MNKIKIVLQLIILCVITRTSNANHVEGGSPSPAPYVLLTTFLTGANITFDVFNTIQIVKGANNKSIPITGLFTGASQIALGIANYSTFKEMQGISIFNIGLGTTTIMLSAWNLITNKKPKEKKTSFNFSSFPTNNKSVGFAFTFKRKF